MTRTEVLAADVAEVEHLAREAFSNHQVHVLFDTVNGFGRFASWNCESRPWIHDFDLTVSPGFLLVKGDIGLCAWSGDGNLLKDIDDPERFAAKVVKPLPAYCWSEKAARRWLKEVLDILKSDAANKVKLNWQERRIRSYSETLTARFDYLDDCVEDGEYAFIAALEEYPEWIDALVPNLTSYDPNYLWCREAVKWLMAQGVKLT